MIPLPFAQINQPPSPWSTYVWFMIIAIGLIDRWGRRPMLITSFVIMAIGMASVGTLLATGVHTHVEQLATVAMLLIFVVGFATYESIEACFSSKS